MWLKVKMLKDWEDLGETFKKGKVYMARELEFESEFYFIRMATTLYRRCIARW